MAERGGGANETDFGNPFSFKAFMNVKENKPPVERDIFSDDDEEEDIFASNSSGAAKQHPAMDHDDKLLMDTPKENPFSFKKFLSTSSSTNNSTSHQNPTPPAKYGPPDIASDIPIFTNSHFESDDTDDETLPLRMKPSHSSTSLKKSEVNKKKKNTSLPSGNSIPQNQGRNLSKQVPNNPIKLPLFDDNDDEDEFESGNGHASGAVEKTPVCLQLPDFLSDGPLHGGRHTMPVTDGGTNEDDLLSQISKLQEDNKRLQSDLTNMQQKYDDKKQRISQLKNDLERQKKKEAEETAVMEKAVLQVEENLVTTTQRAVQAESSVTKLKQEVKSLQVQVRSLSEENESYRKGDSGLSDIRERTKYASEQLKTASAVAEKNLKDLLLGVDKMKLLSQVLATWDKITEVKPDASTESATADEKKSPP